MGCLTGNHGTDHGVAGCRYDHAPWGAAGVQYQGIVRCQESPVFFQGFCPVLPAFFPYREDELDGPVGNRVVL